MKTKTDKNKLTNDLRSLLNSGNATSQEKICEELERLGHEANQSKVSRLLRKLGAVKSKNEKGEIVYRLSQDPAPPTIDSSLSTVIIDIVSNETTIIIYLSPGSAQLIARILDYHKYELKILATIAGDDTLFVAPVSVANIDTTVQALKNMLF